MIVKIFRHSLKLSKLCLELAAVLLTVAIILAALFFWRLSTGPFDVSFAHDYIEQALRDDKAGYTVKLENVVLEWPQLRGPMMLNIHDLRLQKKGQTVLSVGQTQIGLSGVYLLAGRIAPVSIILTQPSLYLIRTAENQIRLSLQDQDSDVTVGEDNPFEQIVNALAQQPAASSAYSPLTHLRIFQLEAARMTMEDHVLGVSWYLGNLNLKFARDSAGLVVTASIPLPAGHQTESIINVQGIYQRASGNYDVSLNFKDVDPRVFSRKIESLAALNDQDVYLNGRVTATLDSGFHLRKAALNMNADKGVLIMPGGGAAPFAFDSIALQADYDLDAKTANIQKFLLQAPDVQAGVAAKFAIDGNSLKGPVSLDIPTLAHDRLKALWPLDRQTGSAADWILKRVSGGTIKAIKGSLDLDLHDVLSRAADRAVKLSASNIQADFDTDDMNVDYRAPLTPATHVQGHGHFGNDTLTINIDSADIGDMKGSKGHVVIDHIETVGTAKIDLHVEGALPSLFTYISAPPIHIDAKKIGMDTARIKGRAALDVNIAFPTTKTLLAEQVKVSAQGQLSDVVLPHAFRAMTLTGDSLALSVGGGIVSLKGKGKLDGRDTDFEWKQYIAEQGAPFSTQIIAAAKVDDDFRTTLGLGLEDWVTGALPVKLTYTQYSGGKSDLTLDADATQAQLMVKPLGYIKAPGAAANVKCMVVLQNGALTEIRDLSVKADDMDMTGGRLTFSQGERNGKPTDILTTAQIDHIRLKDTDAALNLSTGANGLLKFDVKGPFLDASAFLEHKKTDGAAPPYSGPPITAAINVDQMRTREGYVIKNAHAFIDLDREGLLNRIDVDAVAGNGPLALHMRPDATGKTILTLNAEDAGATLQAFNIYENVIGGKLAITGEAKDPKYPRDISGAAQITDFRVAKAPVLARLISAISPLSLVSSLNGEGIAFTKLQAQFIWSMRREGDLYVLNKGRTSGNSLGLTFGGTVDKGKDKVEVEGDIVPLSGVNGLIGNIPLVGSLLTGKNGALFAATYKVTGPVKDPQVSVNPLAVLAPGILRRMLFGGD